MEMISVPVTVPRAMIPFVNDSDDHRTFERNAMMIYPYIQDLTISHGRAAEILGVNKLDLIDFYCSMGLPYLNQSINDLEEEISAFQEKFGK